VNQFTIVHLPDGYPVELIEKLHGRHVRHVTRRLSTQAAYGDEAESKGSTGGSLAIGGQGD
jgi:hypothetical protein